MTRRRTPVVRPHKPAIRRPDAAIRYQDEAVEHRAVGSPAASVHTIAPHPELTEIPIAEPKIVEARPRPLPKPKPAPGPPRQTGPGIKNTELRSRLALVYAELEGLKRIATTLVYRHRAGQEIDKAIAQLEDLLKKGDG